MRFKSQERTDRRPPQRASSARSSRMRGRSLRWVMVEVCGSCQTSTAVQGTLFQQVERTLKCLYNADVYMGQSVDSASKPYCLQCSLFFSKSLSSFLTYVVLVWSLLKVSSEGKKIQLPGYTPLEGTLCFVFVPRICPDLKVLSLCQSHTKL